MADNDFDVFAINESKLDHTYDSSLVKINGYSLERNDRNFNSGGGVAIYIKDNINYKLRTDLIPCGLEIIAIEILKPNVRRFIVCTWYRPPDSLVEVFRKFENFMKSVDVEGKETLVVGDIVILHQLQMTH